jgi:hypothetical protein
MGALRNKKAKEIDSIEPVAIRHGQTKITAPQPADIWGTVTCEKCGAKFSLCQVVSFSDRSAQEKYVAKLENRLKEEHARKAAHLDGYDLEWGW